MKMRFAVLTIILFFLMRLSTQRAAPLRLDKFMKIDDQIREMTAAM